MNHVNKCIVLPMDVYCPDWWLYYAFFIIQD